ncbi:MAG: GlsB/YeaQ/YmgE family stress response membrane protein [Ardenticatenaceae bacterium]|nr:GlsB/YeaQ/YmgE family stress response membrane protein [Ardenticatenaceae bacterium]
MNIILWVILGGVAGWIASMIMKRDAQMGALANIIVGIVGAVLGGFLFNLVGLTGDTGFNLWTLFVAIVGSVVLLFLVGVLRRAA